MQAGVHLNEGEFICEVIDPETSAPAEAGELVITNLGRVGMPVIHRSQTIAPAIRSSCKPNRANVDGHFGVSKVVSSGGLTTR